jgi:hypothetical protein
MPEHNPVLTERTQNKSLRDVVLEALLALGEPVGSREILAYIRKRGYPGLKGKTPRASIQAAVWKDLQVRKSRSPFRMLGRGRNTRKFWLSDAAVKGSRGPSK